MVHYSRVEVQTNIQEPRADQVEEAAHRLVEDALRATWGPINEVRIKVTTYSEDLDEPSEIPG